MKRLGVVLCALIMVVAACPQFAHAKNPGPVKWNWMSRVESHNHVADDAGRYSGETYVYNMLSATRALNGTDVLATGYYMNRFSLDEAEIISNIAGLSLTKVYSPYAIFTLGYSYTSSPERATIVNAAPTERRDRDRFSLSAIFNFNPSDKGVKYSSITSFSTVTDIGEQSTITEKLKMVVPWHKQWESEFSYSASYSFKTNEQLTNQYLGNLTYKFSSKNKLSLGILVIDNVYTGASGDDTIYRLTYKRNIRSK